MISTHSPTLIIATLLILAGSYIFILSKAKLPEEELLTSQSDFGKMQEETIWVFEDIMAKRSLPESAVVDFHFIPLSDTSPWEDFQRELTDLGFKSRRYEDGSTLEVSSELTLSASNIWNHEKQFTLIAEKYGFHPDGWGLMN